MKMNRKTWINMDYLLSIYKYGIKSLYFHSSMPAATDPINTTSQSQENTEG